MMRKDVATVDPLHSVEGKKNKVPYSDTKPSGVSLPPLQGMWKAVTRVDYSKI